MTRLQISFLALAVLVSTQAVAQDSIKEESSTPPAASSEYKYVDEVVATGQQTPSNHPGMRAFFDGDFVAAEISFEREFLKLKRGITARENAAFEATNGQIRSENLAGATGATPTSANSTASLNAASPQTSSSFTPSATGGLKNKDASGKGILTDGKINDDDFSFSKYMAGLSELQLEKFDEAEKSFKSALFYDSKNYDARLRLGLLHLRNREYEKAANQLEKIDKLRRKCIKASCDDRKFITDAAVELANEITKIAKLQKQKSAAQTAK